MSNKFSAELRFDGELVTHVKGEFRNILPNGSKEFHYKVYNVDHLTEPLNMGIVFLAKDQEMDSLLSKIYNDIDKKPLLVDTVDDEQF